MPATNFKGVQRMAARCGAAVPDWLAQLYDGLDDDVESRKAISAAVMADQVEELRREGFEQFHFYTLNQADLTYATCRLLGLRERQAAAAKASLFHTHVGERAGEGVAKSGHRANVCTAIAAEGPPHSDPLPQEVVGERIDGAWK
jgi:hypothetical protein